MKLSNTTVTWHTLKSWISTSNPNSKKLSLFLVELHRSLNQCEEECNQKCSKLQPLPELTKPYVSYIISGLHCLIIKQTLRFNCRTILNCKMFVPFELNNLWFSTYGLIFCQQAIQSLFKVAAKALSCNVILRWHNKWGEGKRHLYRMSFHFCNRPNASLDA